MYENLFTSAGQTMMVLAIVSIVTAFVLLVWPRAERTASPTAQTQADRPATPVDPNDKSLSNNTLRKIFGAVAFVISILLFISSYSVGQLDFTAVYDQKSTGEIIAGQPSASLGSPFIVLDEGTGFASFIVRNDEGVVANYTVSTRPESNFEAEFGGTWVIVDDAQPGTAHVSIEPCTLVPVETGAPRTAFNSPGTRPFIERCPDRKIIHIPRIESETSP